VNTRAIRFSKILLLMLFLNTLPALFAQSSLSMSDPTLLAKVVNSKAEIERCIILATPESLAQAKESLAQTKVVSDEDKRALSEIIRGLSSILYPSAKTAAFFIDPKVGALSGSYSLSLTQLVEASQGKVFGAPKGSDPSFLHEILPALAIFKSQDKEVGRNALGYAQRFAALPDQASVIPGLVKARHEKLFGDLVTAYYNYVELLETYPNLWPARLELGVISLELSRPVNALAFLRPLADLRMEDPAFIKPYSIALYRNGKLAEAEPFVRNAMKHFPDYDDLSILLAHILIDGNNFQSAQPLVDAFGKKHPNDRLYLYLKTQLVKSHGRHDETLKWARKAIQAYPSDPEIMILLAGILFEGPESGHKEAVHLSESALAAMAAAPQTDATGLALYNPLQIAMRQEAKGIAERYLLMEAYNHQNWYVAATMLDNSSMAGLDKEVVSTILRRSGRATEALAFASEWYTENPNSEVAVESYLRSLAASFSGIGLASASGSVSDAGSGFLGGLGSGLSAQPVLLSLAIQFLANSSSKEMRSYLYYLQGSLMQDPDQAIDAYRKALLERADNVEALAALAKAYADKNDKTKALFYIKQARMVGISDQDLESQLKALETTLAQG